MLGDRGDAASRLVGALSAEAPSSTEAPLSTEAGSSTEALSWAHALPSSEPNDAHRDDVARYRALVSALLDVRPDHVGGYFDEALDAALAANRVDVHLARTLRWWQRASVRATEDFVAHVIPTVMAALDDADIIAERDAAANATAWQQAQAIAALGMTTPADADTDTTHDTDDTDGPDDADDTVANTADADDERVSWKPPMRLVAVPDPPATSGATRAASTRAPAGRIRRSTRVRAVRMPDFDAPIADVSIDEIDSMLTFEREGPRGHAHPASSA